MASMDREQQQAVYTHFIRPFLSRNDSSDPGCVSFNRGSKEWLQGNFGNFSGFAKLRDLQHLNANFSSILAVSPSTEAVKSGFRATLATSRQMASMDREQQQAVYTHFIRPFLSRNDSSGNAGTQAQLGQVLMACGWYTLPMSLFLSSSQILAVSPSTEAVKSGFRATWQLLWFCKLRDLQHLNANFSSVNPGCVSFNRGSKEWLQGNFGNFSGFATLQDLQALNSIFSTVEVAYLLTVSQLAQLAATPSHLETKMDVTNIMKVINPVNLGAFFDIVSPAIE
ncbi:hypothetical protein F7725_007699, partial [Dissostichus mawsoni]